VLRLGRLRPGTYRFHVGDSPGSKLLLDREVTLPADSELTVDLEAP